MEEINKSLRIRTNINSDSFVSVNLNQTYDTFEILSLKLRSEDMYRLHNANYGVIVGRVLANENFGIPNAKISVFIEGDFENSEEINSLYPYQYTSSKNGAGLRYNLLPDNRVNNCHQVVGSFPNKTYLLDNDTLIEVYDKYYVYTTRTNNAGDYIIAGVPVGTQTLHMDLDLSDCGILSQRPRDFVYKGYTIEQFENPNQFKTGTNLDSLSQIFSQDQVVNVIPFWGNADNGETIGITRADIDVAFKFEPTCVFIGSVVADNSSNGISKKCVPTNQMGAMDELTTGEGTIEMIRKTPGGSVEEFQIKGTELIDGNGVWCYQIPMNLDYMMTDEYGNMVPTDDPSKGIPTRTRVRFRVSMQDNEMNIDNYFRAKVLVPHNPQTLSGNTNKHEDYDYEFGSNTREDSFRDLMWNNVYTVKSYIPRFQKSRNIKTERFTGIKHCNIYGNNNPMPYNNIRIKLPLIFTILCALIKTYIRVVYVINSVLGALVKAFAGGLGGIPGIGNIGLKIIKWLVGLIFGNKNKLKNARFITIADGLCPDLENWYFAPTSGNVVKTVMGPNNNINMLKKTLEFLEQGGEDNGSKVFSPDSVEVSNKDDDGDNICLTVKTDYLISCVEMALAQEYKVINFDFYNDWVNGVIYMPRWMRFVRKKRNLLFGLIRIKQKIKSCSDDTSIFKKTRYYVQQCALSYAKSNSGIINSITTANGCVSGKNKQKCHKSKGKKRFSIFGGKTKNYIGNGGVVHETQTMKQQYVYYLKPCEWRYNTNKKTILFANDIVLLGSLLDCNMYGIPQAFKYLTSSSYIMPTNLALTNMDDDGYLYADSSHTMCTGVRNKEESLEYKVEPVDVSFTGTQTYYSTSNDDRVTYGIIDEDNGASIFDDTIPLTEAAGIAWNYTGPGQGSKSTNVNRSLYYPGGHFLGMSCVNSETNIKSCINLQRICEVGSNESQRREEVRSIEESNGTYNLNARYFVPTGLIANDEINGSEFRTMFATMNHRRLLCDNKYDDKTGYPIYDFIYLRNAGFDGALNNKVRNDAKYNTKLDIQDEYAELMSMNAPLDAVIERDENEDVNETGETFTRTLEIPSVDYYKFRMGLEDLSMNEQGKRFLIKDGSSYSLPQYENSFYFYFGLRNGATAFDEFNKQFFSVCENQSILKRSLKININEVPNTCNLTSQVTIFGSDAIEGLNIRYEYNDVNGNLVTVEIPTNEIHLNGGIYTVDTRNLPFGSYTFIANDDNLVEARQTITLGSDSISANISTKDFEFKTTEMSFNQVSVKAKELGNGYIDIDDVIMDGESITPNVTIVEKNKWGTVESYYGRAIVGVTSGTNVNAQTGTTDSEGLRIYLWKSGVKYDVYIWNTCNKSYFYGSYLVGGIDNIDLFLGSYYFPYSTKLSTWTDGWWNNIGTDNGVDNWLKRYAVFRRTDVDTDYYRNNVFGLNTLYDSEVSTTLFGQPEKEVANGMVLTNGYYCENETFDGAVDNSTVIATWYSGVTVRQNFCEMVVNDGVIASSKEGNVTVSNITETDGSYTVTTNTGSFNTNTGYIFKTSYGTILYGVGLGGNKFRYEGDEINEGETLSWHKTFKYPVMYRPFYVNAYVLDWISPSIIVNGESYELGNDNEKYQAAVHVYNGLTYNGHFSAATFNGVNIQSGLTRGNDLEIPNAISIGYVDNIDSAATEPVETFEYEITEGCPSNLTDEQTQPFGIDLLTRNQSEVIDAASSVRKRTDSTGTYIDNDINDVSEGKYYLVKDIPCPITIGGNIYKYINDPEALFVLGRYMEGFDVAHQIVSTKPINDGKYVVCPVSNFVYYTYTNISGETVPAITETIGSRSLMDIVNQDLSQPSGGVVGAMMQRKKIELVKGYSVTNRTSSFVSYVEQISEAIESGRLTEIKQGVPIGTSIGTNDYVVAYNKLFANADGKSFMKLLRIYPNIGE